MPLLVSLGLACAVSYLIGAIPTAYIFGKIYKKIDIRQFGSGNIGAANTFRVLGKGPGIAVLLLDIAKGLVPTAFVAPVAGLTQVFSLVAIGLCAVVGHNWTIFLNFRGGKGIATSLGVLIGLAINIPGLGIAVLACLLAWAVVFLVTGYVSLASIIASILLPAIILATRQSLGVVTLGVIFCVFVVLRHRPNIQRLFLGKEPQVNWPFRRTPLKND
ncbi:MAG: glycerol-3-phosphate 1-O-acyltransferase PlsY [Candidatus Omnitrophota bacterium]|nr:glycerol-3-phosphate 1-O-acyltransferase PlsY [Candidatus Omnitrophota bacterium]